MREHVSSVNLGLGSVELFSLRLRGEPSGTVLKLGGGEGIRTPDPLHAMQVLYQLSYTPRSHNPAARRLYSKVG